MVQLFRSSALQTEDRLPVSQPRSSHGQSKQLWVAVYLPDLALNAVADGHPDFHLDSDRPAAVFEPAGGQLRIVAVNGAARSVGIRSGLSVSAAMALTASIELLERSITAEDRYLEGLAEWSNGLTPIVSLQAREGLLLEVHGSLNFLGGLDAIKRALIEELHARRLDFQISTAPTPLAALWLARHGNVDLSVHREFVGCMAALPLVVTAWPDRIRKLLHEMGLTTIGDCLRLSRAGFARRVGKDYLDELDKALGKQYDLRKIHSKNPTLSWAADLFFETVSQDILVSTLESGIEVIAAELRQRQVQIKQVRLQLKHLRGLPTIMNFEFVEPVHAVQHLLTPLVVRMGAMKTTSPVCAFMLETGPLIPMSIGVRQLFESLEVEGALPGSSAVLIECLRGRFGKDGVYGLSLRAEHRPELAFEKRTEGLQCSVGDGRTSSFWGERPLWILPQPLPLSNNTLRTMSRSHSQPKPERIESGWWDGKDVRRDYYTVITGDGERWWVYRDCVTCEWRLHGVFG
jgi:protein ImuB